MSRVDLGELQALLDAGEKGPWMPYSQRDERVAMVRSQGATILYAPITDGGIDSETGRNNQADHNVCLAAGAVNALPALLEEVRAGREVREALRGLIGYYGQTDEMGIPLRSENKLLTKARAALASPSVSQEKANDEAGTAVVEDQVHALGGHALGSVQTVAAGKAAVATQEKVQEAGGTPAPPVLGAAPREYHDDESAPGKTGGGE